MESKLTSCCYIVLQALVLVTSSPETDFGCRLQCPLQNRTQDILYEVGCGADCKISQCLKGCSLWEKALEASCQAVCNGTQELLPPKELYCVMGCNDALNRYLQNLKEELGTPSAPALVADTLTATSLKLEWDRNRFPELTAVIQWALAAEDAVQAEELQQQQTTWQYAGNQSWDSPGQVLVGGLRPYTKYRFRVTLLAQESELTSSEPSLVISTLPSGLPSSPPSLLRAAATDPTRVSASWSPGVAPNGPILSYVVAIDELPRGYKAHKDIPATETKEFYIFQGLHPSRNYTVSVAMRNAVGVGPPATTVVTTPPMSHIKGLEKTILILGAHHSVFSQAADMLDEPVVMYRTKERIRGVAVHIRKGLLFVSDSTGRVLVTSSRDGHYPPKVLLDDQGHDFIPHSLSVDWLNNQLYILAQVANGRWQVTRCELDGSGMTVAVAGLLDKPLHVEVDPYNGYLFWVVEGINRGGLYRLDTAHISNGIKHEVKPDLILQNPDLGAFTVDHTNFRILVSSHAKNTVLAVSLDGKEVTDLRHNTLSPQFKRVLSLTMANGLLYWTNGDLVLTEEYHNGKDSYFHNVIVPDSSDPGYVSIGVDLPSAQPVPSPINPPTGMQAVMGAGHIRASWNIPHLLGGQGKGAWQNWSYQLSVENVETGEVKIMKDINDTRAMVNGLAPAKEYRVRCAAATSAGVGPWSGTFVGRTLSERGVAARLVWGSITAGLVVSDPAAESLSTYLYREHFQDNRGGTEYITDIAWHKDLLYLVTNSSRVLWYSTTTREHGRLNSVSSVGSIAVDWVGNKLYWSSPKQQLLTRGSLNGSDQEPLPILTVAKELNIDSEGAYIYWSTGHAVECARLNGKQRKVYYPAELFSGKQVMGLTLDTGSRKVFWVVRNYEGSSLFKAEMADGTNKEIGMEKVTLGQNHDILGPVVYLDERLVWVRDDRQAVIGDLSGSNSALLASPSLTDLSVLAVVDQSLHTLSRFEGDSEPSAIPEAVDVNTLKVIGNHSSFNLTWDPVVNVNVGQVFYELKVSPLHRKEIIIETTEPTWSFPKDEIPPPYSQLDVTLRALTYWGGSSTISSRLYSPQTSPSQPSRPRVYVNVFQSHETEVVFRWDPPASPNGLIIGYSVVCWLDGSDSFLCNARDLGPNELSLVTREVPYNATAFFQVRACTTSGCGPTSRAVIARTDKPSPVPRLLLLTNSSLTLVDVDRGTNATVAHLSAPAHIFAYAPQAVFWLDESSQVIIRSHPHTASKHRMVNLNGTAFGLAVDWVGNMLYWSEASLATGETEIRCLDLTYYERSLKIRIRTIIRRPHPISTIQVSPAQSMIYWYEEYSNRSSALWKGSMDGKFQQPFFGHSRGRRRWGRGLCTCPDDPRPGPSFAIDHLSSALVWTDLTTKRLVASDFEGCGCTILVDHASHNSSGLPPTSVTTDQDSIYWSNSSTNIVYSIMKRDLENYTPIHIHQEEVKGVGMISAFGNHLLPYPDLKCLVPSQPAHPPKLIGKNSNSVIIRLTPAAPSHGCVNVSQPSSKFTVYYNLADTNCTSDLTECLSIITLDTVHEVIDLNPFSDYVFMVSETNNFAEKAGIRPELSVPMVFQTAAGAPSPPVNVEIQVLSPTTLLITWDPPQLINSETVFYEVHWTSEELVEGARQKGEQKVEAIAADTTLDAPSTTVSTRIFRLEPSAQYHVWVRAYSQDGEAFSESPHVEVRMFPEPSNLTLVNVTAYSLEMSWQRDPDLPYVRHELEYVDGSSGDWGMLVPDNSTDEGCYTYVMNNLKPRTVYTFRLKIIYVDLTVLFFWPVDNRFSFKTLGDRPSKPGPPVIHHLSGDVAQVAWDPSKDNGSPIDFYHLEGMKDPGRDRRGTNYTLSPNEPWSLYYQGTDNFWVLSSLDASERYRFRVRARNDYGWSEYSESSGSFDLTRAALLHQEITIILWVLTPAAIILTILLFMCVLYRHEKTKKWGCGAGTVPPINAGRDKGPDVELASLRQIPRWSAHIQSSNVLYTAGNLAPVDLLPHLRRDQITLTKFLGSGAFGEVFEGLARSLPESSKEITRVAVKTLRKGASDNEKAEFLKEAQLMSNFRHPHILQLLGVCLDNDPHFIIMELMEGGDLLSYLRASRPHLKMDDGLRLLDLVSMCVDVARGCCYLEEMHFVHRDLACRNCLVSSRKRSERLVKIGDFGLARDIYKNDYYRKEGEGLLPVRWMAPESLVDGVFTSQSDVWSFGVLLWEIMSLGQQPYPARNNLEVLNYVRTGGRLGQPVNSDLDLYDLMIKCWSFNPAERPTFKYCLEVLEDILSHTENVSLTTSGLPNGFTRKSSDSRPSDIVVPKYLELLYDGGSAAGSASVMTAVGEGYEVPRTLEGRPGPLHDPLPSPLPDLEEASRLLPPSPTSPGPS